MMDTASKSQGDALRYELLPFQGYPSFEKMLDNNTEHRCTYKYLKLNLGSRASRD